MDKDLFVSGVTEKYDKRLLEGRITAEGNVCGCLLKDLTLKDDSGLKQSDFLTSHGRILFHIVEILRSKSFTECDEITYISNINEEIRTKIEEQIGGWRQISNLIDVVSLKNWDAFLDNLNKSNTIIALYNKGFNIFNPITLDNGKSIVPIDYFKKLTSAEVVEFYEGTLATLDTKINSSKIIEEGYVDFDDVWLQSVKEQQELGISIGDAGFDINGNEIRTFPFMSSNLLGLKPGTMSGFAAQSGTGKALPNYTMIPTPLGNRRVGDIRPGDLLYDHNFQPTKVLMIHPQPTPKAIWRLFLDDGRVAECCKDHLWEVWDENQNCFVLTTEEIREKMQTEKLKIRLASTKNKEPDCLNVINLLKKDSEEEGTYYYETKNKVAAEYMLYLCRLQGLHTTFTQVDDKYVLKIIPCKMFAEITEVVATEEYTEMTCFTVDNPEHLFLTNDYIVTHNTSYMVTVMMSLISKGEKVLMVTNESRLTELKAIFMIWVLYRCIGYPKMSKRRFLSGANFSKEDEDAIAKAKKFWTENYAKNVKIVALSDADASLSAQIIKKHIVRDGFTTFLVDTMKVTISESKEDSGWMSLIKDCRALTEIALKYNVIGLLTLQLAPSMENRLWLDVSCLANCRQAKETLSNLIMFRKLKPEELDPASKIYIKPFRRKQNSNGEWYDEPYEADPNKQWIIMFTDKCRRGIDSGMDGTAFLCRSDLDHASFYETAKCYPSRKIYDNIK